jgi:hypothetical protein
VLRRLFIPKREKVTGGRKILLNEELHDMYPSPSVIITNKSSMMKWAWHVARMGEKRSMYVSGGNARCKDSTRKTKT